MEARIFRHNHILAIVFISNHLQPYPTIPNHIQTHPNTILKYDDRETVAYR